MSEQEGHAPEQIVAAVIKKIATEKDIPPDGDISLQQVDSGNKLTVKFTAKSNTNYKKKKQIKKLQQWDMLRKVST